MSNDWLVSPACRKAKRLVLSESQEHPALRFLAEIGYSEAMSAPCGSCYESSVRLVVNSAIWTGALDSNSQDTLDLYRKCSGMQKPDNIEWLVRSDFDGDLTLYGEVVGMSPIGSHMTC